MNPLRDLTPGPLYAQYLNEVRLFLSDILTLSADPTHLVFFSSLTFWNQTSQPPTGELTTLNYLP